MLGDPKDIYAIVLLANFNSFNGCIMYRCPYIHIDIGLRGPFTPGTVVKTGNSFLMYLGERLP